MVAIVRSALVDFSAQQMFDLVNDIEAYPHFMVGCLAAEVLERADDFVEASLTLGKSGFQQRFVTRNELYPPELMVMNFVNGPFKTFNGRWSFQALSDTACKVCLNLEFEFSNQLLAIMAGPWFEEVSGRQVESLCQRAREVYAS